MSASSAFNDEKGGSSSVGEAEYAYDPVSGKIFSSDYNRYVGRSLPPPDAVNVEGSAAYGRGQDVLCENSFIFIFPRSHEQRCVLMSVPGMDF